MFTEAQKIKAANDIRAISPNIRYEIRTESIWTFYTSKLSGKTYGKISSEVGYANKIKMWYNSIIEYEKTI